MYEIDQIEKDFHKATTMKDIDLMLSLYAPNATFTVGRRRDRGGLDEIGEFWTEKSPAFDPTNNWISDHPAYKLRDHGERRPGTLHFECHFVDAETGAVVAVTAGDCGRGADRRAVADHELRRRNDRALGIVSPCPTRALTRSGVRSSTSGRLSRIDDPFVRAVARLPITVRTKLLIAFVGTSLLLVAVGLLGQLVLGQSNDRVVSRRSAPGTSDRLRTAPGRDVSNLRNLLAENVGEDFYEVWTGRSETRGTIWRRSIDTRVAAVRVIEAGTAADRVGLHAAS